MSKRPCSSGVRGNAVKKQKIMNNSREIRSLSEEKTLQLLYKGSLKSKKEAKKVLDSQCYYCKSETEKRRILCKYCDKNICNNCFNICYYCKDGFCPNCSFFTYDQRQSACYSCYK